MNRSVAVSALFCLVFIGTILPINARADQRPFPLILGNLQAGQKELITLDPSQLPADADAPAVDFAFRCSVPSFSVGVVTLARLQGPAQVDIEVADHIEEDGAYRIATANVVAKDYGDSRLPKVLTIAPESSSYWRLVVLKPRGLTPSRYVLYCDNVNLAAETFKALLQAAITSAFRDNSSASNKHSNEMAGRAVNLIFSVIQRNNVYAVGLDVVAQEINIELEKEYPNDPDTVTFLSALADNVLQKIYEHAFEAMAGK